MVLSSSLHHSHPYSRSGRRTTGNKLGLRTDRVLSPFPVLYEHGLGIGDRFGVEYEVEAEYMREDDGELREMEAVVGLQHKRRVIRSRRNESNNGEAGQKIRVAYFLQRHI